jgi:predicted TIM-barrel fold metal-dependent hydrolase
MDELIVVSADSHAGVPQELWPEYLEARYHDLLPGLHRDNEVYPSAIFILGAKSRSTTSVPEVQEAHVSGYHGLHDAGLRLADMDREGVAAELIYHGDFRLGDMFHNNTNKEYPLDAWDAGARAWNRWCADNFGFASDRFLVVGAIGPCVDMDTTCADLDWMADHDFAGVYAPGYMRHPGLPPLFDDYWEPFWARCEERGLAVVVHAGFGWDQGVVFPELERIYNSARDAAGGSDDRAELVAHADAVQESSIEFFHEFSGSVRPRRPMWQLMLGGVFDRHPGLKLVLTEVRADWIPATLRHLDAVYAARSDDLPAKRTPSEYWHANCLVGASFIHKAEVEMRHEIGVETIAFGRDFPHPEGTWPNTKQWLHEAFNGVPEDELRLMLGENAIRFFDLDRDRLAELARRIGPTYAEITRDVPDVTPELLDNFASRGGYLKPAEGGTRLDAVDELLQEDLVAVSAKR